MIDHINLPVLDLGRSRRFYTAVLAPLGLKFLLADGEAIGFGKSNWQFGLMPGKPPIPRVHVAFHANSHAAVDAFYQAALAAGATPNGEPGPRPQYDATYYAAFVLDPDGHNIEAVCHGQGTA